MKNQSLFHEIVSAFPGCATAFSDAVIEANPSLPQLDGGIDSHVVVPAYMAWCARHSHNPALVHDYTINVLAEFGRAKNLALARSDFKQRCNQKQKDVILMFLRTYLNPALAVNPTQVSRSIKRWPSG